MTRCDHCGNEVTLPFSCQYCGGKFCPECRLPPNHTCRNIGTWKSKPVPSVGISYGKGGSAKPTGGVYIPEDARRKTRKGVEGNIPYLKIMIAVIVIILLGVAYLVISGK